MGKKKKNESRDVCRDICFNEEKVNRLKTRMPSDEEIGDLSDFYKVLGNNTRVKIIFALSEGELCVCDIAHILGLSLSATSHQLKLLKGHKLLKYRNDGKMVYYSLNVEKLFRVMKGDISLVKGLVG